MQDIFKEQHTLEDFKSRDSLCFIESTVNWKRLATEVLGDTVITKRYKKV